MAVRGEEEETCILFRLRGQLHTLWSFRTITSMSPGSSSLGPAPENGGQHPHLTELDTLIAHAYYLCHQHSGEHQFHSVISVLNIKTWTESYLNLALCPSIGLYRLGLIKNDWLPSLTIIHNALWINIAISVVTKTTLILQGPHIDLASIFHNIFINISRSTIGYISALPKLV